MDCYRTIIVSKTSLVLLDYCVFRDSSMALQSMNCNV